MTRPQLILRYAGFAALAMVANLAIQRLVLLAGSGAAVFAVAIVAGTIVGLAIKYLLDKRWIFYDRQTGLRAHGQKFSRYAAFGLITTGVFWGSETAFWMIWHSDKMRELGAILGLTIGYVLKYQLDRRFVFVAEPAAAPA